MKNQSVGFIPRSFFIVIQLGTTDASPPINSLSLDIRLEVWKTELIFYTLL
ncbi:MAG: hypothetical protein IJK87_09845 [Prevotella sp.]|nr:hypothetical protein [Prevotella sp.]